MEVVLVGLVALLGGCLLGAKLNAKTVAPALTQVLNTQAIDRASFLQTLRRELANMMVWRNPRRFLQLYRELNIEISSFQSWKSEKLHDHLGALTRKYAFFSDFDAIGTRDYILYANALSWKDDDEIENHYRDIVIFTALSALVDDSWKDAASKGFVHTTSNKELDHLTEYVQKIEDTKLTLLIERSMDDNAIYRINNQDNIDSDFYKIVQIPSSMGTRYGIHVKRTNEFAIYEFDLSDDGRISYRFYRSNPNFTQEDRLDPIRSVLAEAKIER